MSFTIHYRAFGVVKKSTFWGKIFQQKKKEKKCKSAFWLCKHCGRQLNYLSNCGGSFNNHCLF